MIDFEATPSDGGSTEADPVLAEWVAEAADRVGMGETVDADGDAYADDPGDAGRVESLRRVLPAMEMIARLRDPARRDGSPRPAAAVPAIEPARILGDFRSIRVIGRGGMGVVYEAVQISLDRRVALKVLPAVSAQVPWLIRRFQVEAQAVACLHHPHIVPVYAIGLERGVHYFAMQLIEGPTLAELIAECRSPAAGTRTGSPAGGPARIAPRLAAELGRQAAEALHHAHENGVIHRDVKPANLLLQDDGWLWVADFGLARVRGGLESTASGAIRGTPRYMSPEQALGGRRLIDHRTDVYSLGATLYELLTLRPAYGGDDRLELLRQIARETPRPRRIAPEIPLDLETIVLKAMAKDPAERYATAGDLADDLGRFLDQRPIRARRPGLLRHATRWARSHRPAVAAAGVVALAVVAGLGGAVGWRDATLRRNNLALRSALAVAERSDLTNRRLWYGSQVRLAQQDLSAGQVEFAQQVLEGLRPAAGERDLRAFEWHCLRQSAHRDVSVLFGHDSPVSSLALSPDARTLVSGDQGGDLLFWDLVQWRLRARVRGHGEPVHHVAFAPDGRTVAALFRTPNGPDEVTLWDPATARRSVPDPGIRGRIVAFAFSRDGRTLLVPDGDGVAGGANSRVRFWDVSRAPARVGPGPRAIACKFAAISADRAVLATAGPSGALTLRDAATGRALRRLSRDFATILQVSFHAIGRSVRVVDEGGVSFFDAATGREERRIAATPAEAGSYCSPGTPISLLPGPPMRHGRDIWLDGPCPSRLEGGLDDRDNYVFSPDAGTLATAGVRLRPTLWDTRTGEKRGEFSLRMGNVSALAFTPRGESLVFGSEDMRIRVWHVKPRPEPLGSLAGHRAEVWSLAYTPDGSTLASAADDHAIKLWDPRTGALQATLDGHGSLVTSLAVSPDGKTLASAGFDRTVRLWDLPDGRARAVLGGHTDRVRRVAFSPDGSLLASCSSDSTIRLWDAASRRELAVLRGHSDSVHVVAFEPGGARLVSAGNDGTLRVWDLGESHRPQTILSSRSNTALAFSPDGSLFASGDDWGNVTVRAVPTWSKRTEIKGSDAPIWGLAFSPDGRTLASACGDARVRLWDPVTGQLTLVLDGHVQRVNDVAFSPDGSVLASASHDGAVKLWHAERP